MADWESLTKAIISELKTRNSEIVHDVDSLYIGGGTPSLMPPVILSGFLNDIKSLIPWAKVDKEITIEVNPDDVTDENAILWKESGVNRVSMGIQSFNDDELRLIGRRHDSKKAQDAFEVLRHFFNNVSVDVIFGLPGQTMATWRETVKRLLEMNPPHISAYNLMFEEKTPLSVLKETGKLNFPDEDDIEEMWIYLSEELKRNGYEQYEISNYCKPGFRSNHNSKYWNQSPYLGLGPSAHSYNGDTIRRSNPSNINGYIKHYLSSPIPLKPFYEEEELNEEELSEEFILTRMRTKEGIPKEEYRRRFGAERWRILMRNVEKLRGTGWILESDGKISLSKSGLMRSDSVILQLSM